MVQEIIESYISARGRKSYADLAADYDISYSTVPEIIQGQIWIGVVPAGRLSEAQRVARDCARQKPSSRRS